MAGPIALVGGDEFRPGCEDMDRVILDSAGVERPSLLIVPTAAAAENPSKAASNGVAYFSALGCDASALMVLDRSHANDEELISTVDTADVVYFTGGSPRHLLDTLTGSALLQKLVQALDRGAVLAGSSAGAMVLGPRMRFAGWNKALGIVPSVAILPHHEQSDPDSVAQELVASAAGLAVLGIDGRTCCLGGPNNWKILGAGKVALYHRGTRRSLVSGEVLTLDPAPARTES